MKKVLIILVLLMACGGAAERPYDAPAYWKARPFEDCVVFEGEVRCLYSDDECWYWIRKTKKGWEQIEFLCVF